MVIVCAYAPHSGYPFDVRQEFFQQLNEFLQRQSCHGPKIVCGDFNARLYWQQDGDSAFLGPYLFSNELAVIPETANKYLLLELCASSEMVVSNTFFDVAEEQQITSYNVGSQNAAEVSWSTHSQIDFLLCQRQ